ncbi:MAG: succinate dehydrogenase [Lachnospiraceae bacterium]|jgi:succinate dehydrogenase/fumarate reductase-like Fe-S protein|nr:succinate dehydrogenase [Lachnospiraceae bacterium]
MKVYIDRFEPAERRRWVQEYEVDTAGRSMTVMDVLLHIADHMDPTLAFFRHSMCNHGICARCVLLADGKVCLACTELIGERKLLKLAPVPGKEVVRDLVVRF